MFETRENTHIKVKKDTHVTFDGDKSARQRTLNRSGFKPARTRCVLLATPLRHWLAVVELEGSCIYDGNTKPGKRNNKLDKSPVM